MKLIDKLENREEIKKALEIEVKNRYINIVGKRKSFSKYMLCVDAMNGLFLYDTNPY